MTSRVYQVGHRMAGRTSVRCADVLQTWWGPAALVMIVTFLWMAPLMLHLGSRMLGSPSTSDAWGGVRSYSAIAEQHKTPFTVVRDPYVGAPEGIPSPAAVQIVQPIQHAVVWYLARLVGLVAAFNIFLLSGFVLTGIAALRLLQRLGLGSIACAFGAYIITFNPWTFARALAGHAAFVHVWVLLLLLHALLSQNRKPDLKRAVIVGAAYGLTFLMASYWGLLATATLAVFLVVPLVRARSMADRLWVCTLACVNFGVCLLVLLPALIAYVVERSAVSSAIGHPTAAITQFSARPPDYLFPAVHQRLIGWIGSPFVSHNQILSSERSLFFGWTTIALALLVLDLHLRRAEAQEMPRERARAISLFGLLLPVSLVLSLPPTVTILGLTVPTPSDIVAHVTTYYRVYARFGILVGICLAVLAATAFDVLRQHWRTRWLVLLAAVTLIQLLPPSLPTSDAAHPPPWDAWLATQPRGIVTNYPMETDQADSTAFALAARELYYQRFTRDPLYNHVGAAWTLTREGAIRIFTRYVDSPTTPEVLAAEGVRYVVLHDDVYRAEGAKPPQLSAPFRLVKRFKDVRIYTLPKNAARADIDQLLETYAPSIALVYGFRVPQITYRAGFGRPLSSSGQYPGWRVANPGATFTLKNMDTRVKRAQIVLRVKNPSPDPIVISIAANGGIAASTTVPAGSPQVTLGPFGLVHGSTDFTLGLPGNIHSVVLGPPLIQPLADYSTSIRAQP